MTMFIPEAVADTPSWMYAHHPLSVPDVLVSTKDPAIRQQWIWDAQTQRDQTVRLWTMEERAVTERTAAEVEAELEADADDWQQYPDGPLLWRGLRQTTPTSADAWLDAMAKPPGHRLVLVDPAAPNLLDNLLDTTGDEGCDVCDETRPSLAYDAHRKHQERAA